MYVRMYGKKEGRFAYINENKINKYQVMNNSKTSVKNCGSQATYTIKLSGGKFEIITRHFMCFGWRENPDSKSLAFIKKKCGYKIFMRCSRPHCKFNQINVDSKSNRTNQRLI